MRRVTRRVVRAGLVLVGLVGAAGGGWAVYRYHGPTAPVEIYRGLTYGCDRLADSAEGGGLVHWVRADLAVPGVQLYVTPMRGDARAAGWEYRLRYVSTTVTDIGLAAAVNGTLFASDSRFVRRPGDLARSIETTVADTDVNHVDPNTYLLWWDGAGVARLETTKPPSPDVLARAVWGVGGQAAWLVGGRVWPYAGRAVDRRTVVAADADRHLVWIACFDRASDRLALQTVADLGARIGVLVDGGTSTTMALGPDAHGVRGGTVTGDWRPVGTQVGFKAEAIEGP